MKQIYETSLSSGEIYVLAGLLNYQSVIGIETETLSRWQGHLGKHIKPVVAHLEKQKIILYELNGTILMNSYIHKMLDCLCLTETVWLVSENVKTGKYRMIYVLNKDKYTVLLEKTDADIYEMILYMDFQMEEWLKQQFVEGNSQDLHEKILLEEAELVKNKLQCFDIAEVKKMLRKCLTNEKNADCMLEMFSGKSAFVQIQLFKKNNTLYEHKLNYFVVVQDKQNFELYLDENNVLAIDSVEKTELLKGVMKNG